MKRDFYPNKALDVESWSLAMAGRLVADPGRYGVTADQAAAYDAVARDFSSKLAVALNPATRTRGTVLAKRNAAVTLERASRQIAAVVRAAAGTDESVLIDLNLTVKLPRRRAVPEPATAPAVQLQPAVGGVRVRLSDADGDSTRRKPDDVAFASLFVAFGDVPPPDLADWTPAPNTTKTDFLLKTPATLPIQTRVHVVARWNNPRGQAGPASLPQSSHAIPSLDFSRAA